MDRSVLNFRRLGVAMLGSALFLTACSSDEPREGSVVAAQAEAEAAAEQHEAERLPIPQPTGEGAVGARIYEYHIDLTQDTLDAGMHHFEVLNAGTTSHILIIRNDNAFFATLHIPPGESTVLEADLEAGEYQVVCGVRDEFDHISEGERTHLVVL